MYSFPKSINSCRFVQIGQNASYTVKYVRISGGPTQDERLLRNAHSGNASEISRLLGSGTKGNVGRVSPDARHNLGWTALHVASVRGHRQAVRSLLDAGADPNLPDEYVNIYHTAREKGIHSIDVMVARYTKV